MKAPQTIDRIVTESARYACAHGFTALTVGDVARAAGVSTALIHYHFDTKQRLIVATANRLLDARLERRRAALAPAGGLATLDALWDAVVAGAQAGAARAVLEIVSMAAANEELRAVLGQARRRELSVLAERLPRLLEGLGTSPAAAPEELAGLVGGWLDGAEQALVAGAAHADLRSAYDAVWLALIASSPRGGRR